MTMLALPAPTMLSVRIPFCGFYESIYSGAVDDHVTQEAEHFASSDGEECRHNHTPAIAEIEHYLTDEDLTEFFGENLWDCVAYGDAYRHLAKAYGEEFASWLEDSLAMPVAFEWEEMTSPAYYNFETDRLFAKFSLTVFEEMRRRLAEEAPGALEQAFKDCFTSYDGFHSWYDNTVPEKPLVEWDHNELYALLGAWCNHECSDQVIWEELYDWSIGGLYEEVYRAVDEAMDYDRLAKMAEEWAANKAEEIGVPEDAERPPPRCPDTMEMFS